MLSSLKILAAAADRLNASNAATVGETPGALTIAALDAINAQAFLPQLKAIGWQFEIVDSAGERADLDLLKEDYAPFIITIQKPASRSALQVITSAGLRAFLLEERKEEAWELAMLTTPFVTTATNFLPWGSTAIFSPASDTKSPRQLVKEYNVPPLAPRDIRGWMLRSAASAHLWKDPIFQIFADLSAQALMRALAGEIKNDGALVFKGPPHTQLDAPKSGAADDLGLDAYNDLRSAAAWIYESSAEAEQRHGLFTAEFGRTHPPITEAASAFRRIVVNVLTGARLAYQLSLSDLTREAIKAQGDLRKAVADDTAKLADNTRQVATAVAAALATCIGLVAAKAGTATPAWVIQAIAVVVALYVAAVIISGLIFMSVQRDMRENWRARLYRFVPDADYQAMVLVPARKAECMFWVAAIAGGLIGLIAVTLVFHLS